MYCTLLHMFFLLIVWDFRKSDTNGRWQVAGGRWQVAGRLEGAFPFFRDRS